MARAILEHKLGQKGLDGKFEVDSAAYDGPTYGQASAGARESIRRLLGSDRLASDEAKKLTPEHVAWADIILVMTGKMKAGLPEDKTWTLKEYAGGSGDVADPFGGGIDVYLKCARELSSLLDRITGKLVSEGM